MKDYTLKAKQEVVAGVQAKFAEAQSLVFLDYRGMTVAEVTELRIRSEKQVLSTRSSKIR